MASVDSSDIPAGFFSTFSIADPYNPAPGHVVKAQKRNRRVFVCIPCHRRKLKCDKLIPCSRCVAAEIADECTYMPPPSPVSNRSKKGRDQKAASKAIKKTQSTAHPKVKREYSPSLSVSSISSHMSSLTPCPSSPSRSPSPAPPARKTPEKPITKAKQNHLDPDSDAENCGLSDFDFKSNTSTSIKPSNGASHWSSIACEFPEAAPYLFGTDLQWQQRYRQVRNLKGLFPNFDINNNFPFGNPSPVSRDQVIGLLPPSHIVNTLVTSYLDSFGATHCLFHPVQLQHEIQRFYDAPSDVSDEWLSQLCMILALGAKSSPDFLFSGSGQSAAEWATIFLNAAQASFGRSSYMAAPSLCTVRILCMMVLAKLIEAPASGGSVKRNGSNDTAGHDYTTSRANGHSPLLSLVAFTVNVAASLELHRSSKAMASVASTPPGIRTEKQNMTDSVEAEMRHRIWVTVQLLDISAALRAGTTTVHKPGESDVEPPQPMPVSDSAYGGSDCSTVYGSTNHVETSVGDEIGFGYLGAIPWNDYGLKATSVANNLEVESDFHGDPDGFYKHKLATFLPLLANIVNTVNSPTKPNPRYAQIKVWDERAHKLLDEVKKALLSTNQATSHGMGTDSGIDWLQQNPEQQLDTNMFDSSTPPPQPRRAIMQYQHLEVLAHRALLALHHESFCQLLSSPSNDEHNTPSQKTSALHTLSQAAVVESSLALLNTHRTWAASVASLADRCPSTCTNMTTSTTATATVASIDSPYLSMLHLPGGGGSMLGLIKPTAAEMVMQPQQLQQLQLPLPLSGRSSPIVLGCGSDMASISTGLPMAATATQPSTMQNMGWLLDLNHDDFGAALLYMVLVLRSVHCRGHAHLLGYPRDETAAVTAVRHSYQVMRDRSYRSVAHFKEFLGVAILFACFRGLRSGNMLSQVVDATNDVEQVVVTGRRYLLWAADSLTTPDEAAALIGFNGPLMAYGGL